VIDLIMEDHRRFEALLRDLRNAESDRERVRSAFSALHVAHAEAEEKHVYPVLRRKSSVDTEEVQHGEHEHAEGNEALLALLECSWTDTQKFDDALEKLAELVNHHVTEEELTILNPAREDVPEATRLDLGEKFAVERNRQIDADCGNVVNVRRIVQQAHAEGLLGDSEST
jgi:hemerythrin-like domain-containing protein